MCCSGNGPPPAPCHVRRPRQQLFRRGGASGLRAGAHGPCPPLSMRPDRRFLPPRPQTAAESPRFNARAAGIALQSRREPVPRSVARGILAETTRSIFAPVRPIRSGGVFAEYAHSFAAIHLPKAATGIRFRSGRQRGRLHPGPAPSTDAAKIPKKSTRGFAPGPQIRGKEVMTQGVSVRATRNPRLMSRRPVVFLKRLAERRILGPLSQEPPRSTRWSQSPDPHALPSLGAPA